MKIRFKRKCELIFIFDVCGFSGDHSEKVVTYNEGDTLSNVEVQYGEKEKRKGGGVRVCQIFLDGGGVNCNYLRDVLDIMFEEVKDNGLMLDPNYFGVVDKNGSPLVSASGAFCVDYYSKCSG